MRVTPDTLTWNQLIAARFGADGEARAIATALLSATINHDKGGVDRLMAELCDAINARGAKP